MKGIQHPTSNIQRVNPSGFTLIEMLIVIAIIGILASMVLVGLGPVQRQGRDSRRISDLRQVQNALELYFNKCGHYPGDASCGANPLQTDYVAMTAVLTNAVIGIANTPDDPNTSKHYLFGTDGKSYVLGADLEDANNPNLNKSYKVNSYSVDCTVAGRYCVQF